MFDQIHLLFDDEKADPDLVFQAIFRETKLSVLKDFLWDSLETCLTSDLAPFDEPEGRRNAMTYTHYIMKCLEAGRRIVDQRTERKIELVARDPAVKYKDIDSLSHYDLSAAHEFYGDRVRYFYQKASEMADAQIRIANRLAVITSEQSNIINKRD